MRRGSCYGALALLAMALVGGSAQAVEVRSQPAAVCAAPADAVTPAGINSLYRPRGGAGEVLRFGSDDLQALFDEATAGTYTGTAGASSPFTLTVSGNKITGWKLEDYFGCAAIDILLMSISTSCSIAGNNSFTCGSLGCAISGNMRINGSFSGNTVSGKLDLDLDPDFASCCSVRNLSFFATLGGGGGSPPAAPTNLEATAVSDDEVELDWVDHANNELEFRVEMREGSVGSFTDIGSVPANSIASVNGLDPSTLYNFRVRARNASGYSAYSNVAAATTFGTFTGPCVEDVTTLCLNNDRFQIRATFRTAQPQSGQAHVFELTPDTGYLWFFTDSNVEAVIKILNGCGLNNRFWVFAGGLTDVEVILTVIDTETGATKQYTNNLGTKFAPIQDTSAFATCP
jgi:hypothetical protein